MEFIGVVTVVAILFIGLPWLIFHYVTKWKQAPKITVEDEQLLDDMFNLARRLEERLVTVERIAAADHPDWRPGAAGPDWKPGLGAPAGDYQPGLAAPQQPYPQSSYSNTFPIDRRN
jgi:phage shock protein B